MQLRRLTAIALAALALGACGDDDGPDVARPDQLRLTIVSGDGQTAPVRPAGSAAASAGLAPVAALPPNLLPEPLVARIVVDAPSTSVSPLGPSFAALPSDLVVTFRVVQPQDQLGRDCGASFIDSAKPDADGLVTTYWERGTLAGECRMDVRLVVDGQPRVDTVFVATFEPGPPARGVVEGAIWRSAADSLDFSLAIYYLTDVYGNELPWRVDASCCAHPRSQDEADPVDSRKLIADSAGVGTMWIISGADTLRTGVLTVVDTTYLGRAVRWMTADFPDTF